MGSTPNCRSASSRNMANIMSALWTASALAATYSTALAAAILQQQLGTAAGAAAVPVPQGFTTPPFVAEVWAGNLTGARGMVVDSVGDVLVVAGGLGGIYALWEEPSSSSSSSRIQGVIGEVQRALIVNNSELNHGIAIYGNHLYASSPSTVWRWRYTPGQRNLTTTPGEGEVVVRNLNMDESGVDNSSGHQTRTLAIDRDAVLYVSVGSTSNVDSNSFRARIRSFNLRQIPGAGVGGTGGFEFVRQGQVFADGLRNEVGLGFDGRGRLWGVENGADQLNRADLGGDIHNENPAEELNLFDGPRPGVFYGYPFCWSEFNLAKGGRGRGAQWAWPSLENGTITDAWCRNTSNVRRPALAMPAHQAPLGVTFFNGTNCGVKIRNDTSSSGGQSYGFPCGMAGDAFVSFHGSWDSDKPVGFKVSRIRFNNATGLPSSNNDSSAIFDIFGQQNPETECVGDSGRGSCLRPVDVKFDHMGALLVTSDTTGEIIRITANASYSGQAPTPTPVTAPPPGGPNSSSASPTSRMPRSVIAVLCASVVVSLSFRLIVLD